VCVIGAGGKSGSLALAAARSAGAGRRIGVVPTERELAALRAAGDLDRAARSLDHAAGDLDAEPLATDLALADARDPVALAAAVTAAGGPADITVVCVDVPGCEHGAVLATQDRGTVVFFSMATSFAAAALGAEALAADVTMLIGNGYVAGHAEVALDELRRSPGVRSLFDARTASTNPARTSTARTSTAQTSTARTSTARTSTARTSTAQTSTARTSTARTPGSRP
jgi:L-erythro-3,5-diaminohexanoate dehydrogenase